MNAQIAVALAYFAVAAIWFLQGLDESMTGGIILMLLFIAIVEAVATGLTLRRYQKVLEWFAGHIKVNPDSIPDEAPDELKVLVGKESNTTRSNKS